MTIDRGRANQGRAEVASAAMGPRHARPTKPRLSTARAGVLRALMTFGDSVTVTVLADQLGQHPNTVREHLDALVDAGRVERVRAAPSGRGRPAWLYRVAAAATSPLADIDDPGTLGTSSASWGDDGEEYLALAMALIDEVSSDAQPGEIARHAGERWGRALAHRRTNADENDATDRERVLDTIMAILRDQRFEPQRAADSKTMRLTTCPFLDAARHDPTVVCQIHLGIVRGALDELGSDPNSADLREFAEPGACLLTLSDSR